MPSRFTHNSIFILPWTRKFVWIKRGGCVDIWHSYNPSSLLFVSAIRSRQLFGYWKSTLNRGSPLYVCVPTVNNCKCSSFRSRFTHETYRCAHDKIHCERTQRSKEEKSDIRKKNEKRNINISLYEQLKLTKMFGLLVTVLSCSNRMRQSRYASLPTLAVTFCVLPPLVSKCGPYLQMKQKNIAHKLHVWFLWIETYKENKIWYAI